MDNGSSTSSSGDDTSWAELWTTCALCRGQRGRSPAHGDVVSGNLPIITIPTNGKRCMVLQEERTFDMVGEIPKLLHKNLFRRYGPLPNYVAIGTLQMTAWGAV